MPSTEPPTKPVPDKPTPTKGELSGVQVGGYLIGALIGRGGMGDVYRGRHLQLSREVAIKVVTAHASSDPQWRTRFQREARILGALDSPNAVRVFDFGETADGREYLVMELVDGTDVSGLIAQKGRVKPSDALAIAKRVCYALSAAHAVGVVHRDIKPSNVLITKKYVKVADFGLSRPMDGAAASQSGAIIGTPHYMSPEQCEGRDLDGRSDLYNLGAMLYHMLAGDPPYVSTQPLTVLLQHANPTARPVPLTTRVPGTPPELDALVQRLMAKRPEDRPPSADAAAREIDVVLRGLRDGTTAIPREAIPSEAIPSESGPRRFSPVFLAICALAVVLGVGVALVVRGAFDSEDPAPVEPPSEPPPAIDARRQIEDLTAMAADADRSLQEVKLRHDVLALQLPGQRETLLAIYRHALEVRLDRTAVALLSDARAVRIANIAARVDPLDPRAQPAEMLADELTRWHRSFVVELGVTSLHVERCVVDAAGESGRVHVVARLRPKELAGEPQVAFALPFVARHGEWTLAWSPLLAEYDAGIKDALAGLDEWARAHPELLRELGERVDRLRRLGRHVPKIGARLHELEHEGRRAALVATAREFADVYASGDLGRAVDHVWFMVAPPSEPQRNAALKWLEDHRRTDAGERVEAMFVADRGKAARITDDKLQLGEVELVVGLSSGDSRRERRIATHWVLDPRGWAWRVKLEGSWK